MKFEQIGGRFRLSRYSILFGLLALFITAGIYSGNASAADDNVGTPGTYTPPASYADVNRDGWLFFSDGTAPSRVIAVKNGDTSGKQATFGDIVVEPTGARVLKQRPDYYNTSGNQPSNCKPAYIVFEGALQTGTEFGAYLYEDQAKNGCGDSGSNFRDTHGRVGIRIKIGIDPDIEEISKLMRYGNLPYGCTGFPDYPGNPADAGNYNCPPGGTVKSLQNGQKITTAIPRTTTSTSANGDPTAGDGSDVAMTDCEMTYNPISWIMCPIIDGVFAAVRGLDSLINRLLIIDTERVFGTGPANSTDAAVVASNNYYEAWSSFRNIALGLVVITALIIIISSAFGIDMLDAYTIRKALPRVFIAVIGITISWEVTEFLINLTNDIGVAVRGLIYAPFSDMDALQINGLSKFIIGGLLSAAIIVYQWAVLLFGLTAFLGIMIALLTLVVREMILIFLVIIAPIALVAFILPNTQKYWQLWQNTFTTLLIVFPIIAGFIALGRVFSTLAYQAGQGGSETVMNLIAFVAYFLPYFLIPLAFKMAGGVMATLAGIGNDRSKGVFDRLSKSRGNAAKNNYQDALTGRGKIGKGFIGEGYRRAHFIGKGGLSPTSAGKEKYKAARAGLMNTVANKALEEDKGRVAGNDDLMEILSQRGVTKAQAIQQYSQRMRTAGYDEDTSQALAREAVASAEVAFGATVGDGAMRVAAYKAHLTSSTGYGLRANEQPGDNITRAYNDGLELVEDGLLTTTDVVATMKSNKARSEFSNQSFGMALGTLTNAQATARSTGGPARISADDGFALAQDAVMGTSAGELAAAKPETVRLFAQVNAERARQLAQAYGTDSEEYQKHMASVAGLYDAMSHYSPQKAQEMAHGLMGVNIEVDEDGNDKSVQQVVEEIRRGQQTVQVQRQTTDRAGNVVYVRDPQGNPVMTTQTVGRDNKYFLEMRREYGSAMQAAQAEGGQQQQQQPPGP